MTILIGYDGSPDAQAAIDSAASLFAGTPAVVLTVWEGFSEVMARAGVGLTVAPVDFEAIDQTSAKAAMERAEEGCARARAAGLEAQPRVAERGVTIWEVIIEQAEEVRATAIVLGSRGLAGLRSLLLGSVSHGVVQHADRPVLIVPAATVAAERARRRAAATDTE